MDELAAGLPMNKRIRTPLEKGDWPGGKAFLAGVFPGNVRAKVTVRYPDHEIKYNGGSIVITHGHYLDKKQTQLKRLNENPENRIQCGKSAAATVYRNRAIPGHCQRPCRTPRP